MATRLHYALPIARQFLLSTLHRLRHGGLPAQLPPPGERPFIIVTGSGRSGTSAVARALHESGVSMGTDFDPPGETNAVGFYEDKAMRSINHRIVGELGLSAIGSPRWASRSAVLAVAERHSDEMVRLASKASGGWKSPLFSVTLEAWLRNLPGQAKVVVCLRSSEAFLHSVTRSTGLLPREAIERRWANELRRLMDVITDYRLEATCVEYDDLVQRPVETVAALSAFVGLPLDPQYIEPSLRHHVYPVPRRFASLYGRVRSLGPAESSVKEANQAPSGVSLLQRLRGGPPLTSEEARAIDEYVERARAVEARTGAARDSWAERVGRDRLLLAANQQVDGSRSELVEETQAASAIYVEALSEAQAELGARLPPAAFERYHDSLRGWVDRERLVAQLMLQATDDGRLDKAGLETALGAWQQFSSPNAAEQAQGARSREYERALGRLSRREAG